MGLQVVHTGERAILITLMALAGPRGRRRNRMVMMLVVGEWGCATGPLLSPLIPGLSFATCGLVWLASPDSAWRRCELPFV